ncbi:MAG: transcriptional regulator [Gordonia sp. (in: high G+C Gram-positive bacteria)]|nr:MAG: transcriptional regulator [Gordonia sp. (in: high G+C Gram-positive bacteria)]
MSRRVLRGFDPDQLVELRKRKGWTVTDAARVADVTARTLRNWEAGEVSPQIDLLRRLVSELGGSVSDVVRIPEENRFPGDWRVLRALTQPELGRKAGVSTATIGAVERGEIRLSDAVAKAIAQALDVPVDEYRTSHDRARRRPPGTPA